MNLQYCHNRLFEPSKRADLLEFFGLDPMVISATGGTTIALEAFTVEEFETAVPMQLFRKHIGIAKCSEKDNYNKKIGRQIASARTESKQLVVKLKTEDHLFLNDEQGNEYVLRKLPEYTRVHFVEFYGV